MAAPSAAESARIRKRRVAELEEFSSWLLRESKRLLRKHGAKVDPALVAAVERQRAALERVSAPLAADRDLAAVEEAVDALDRGLSASFARYRKSPTREYIEAVGGAVLLALLIRAFVFEAFKIPTGSMIPTLHVHDHLFVNKFLYGLKIPFTRVRLFGFRTPTRGEIVVFEYPYDDDADSAGKDLIKRVVAVAGDRVRLRDNRLEIQGSPIGQRVLGEGDCGEAVENVRACADDPQRTCLHSGDGDGPVLATFASPAEALAKVAELEGYACRQVRECVDGQAWTAQYRFSDAAGRGFVGAVNDANWPPSGFDGLRFGPNARRYVPPENESWPDFIVPDGHLLVMGDNRDNSKDGRFFGLVPTEVVKGKAGFIWYAYERDFWNPNWRRIGQVVHEDAEPGECQPQPEAQAGP